MFIVTLKKATPTVLKFLACAFFIFMGFSIGGWIVLGPYHAKVNLIYSHALFYFH